MRYLIDVSFNGLNYNGFQTQKTGNTIQDELEKTIKIITKEDVKCVGSGRTDAKVSAYHMPVHFDISKTLNKEKFLRSINGILPEDIRVLSIQETTVHARFSAKRKTYQYKMYVSNISLPLFGNALQVKEFVNIKKMKKFLKLIVGTHDFSGFKASGSEMENCIRTIYSAKLIRKNERLNFEITGNGFLYKMVRNIVGTMLKIGEGKLQLNDIKPTLYSTFKATNTARPEFLYLKNVEYKK